MAVRAPAIWLCGAILFDLRASMSDASMVQFWVSALWRNRSQKIGQDGAVALVLKNHILKENHFSPNEHVAYITTYIRRYIHQRCHESLNAESLSINDIPKVLWN